MGPWREGLQEIDWPVTLPVGEEVFRGRAAQGERLWLILLGWGVQSGVGPTLDGVEESMRLADWP